MAAIKTKSLMTFRLSDKLLSDIEKVAKLKGIHRSDLIRNAITEYIEDYNINRPKRCRI
jgi:metal-responsive CopG/Arc/MetJ family transcriptional regulator